MRPELIYYETMVVQWISDGLGHFFNEIGYRMISNTVQEIQEALVPLDRIYSARKGNQLILFALQYKAPYKRGKITGWRIDTNQHQTLSNEYFSRFIWYCFPYMKDISSYKNALYHSHFVCPSICTHPIKWFMWDDYFLYFYPGGGGCNKFLGGLRHLPCGPMPYKILDAKLKRAQRNEWNYTMNFDSWGSLFYKLLKNQIGFTINNDSDFNDFYIHISGKKQNISPIRNDAVILAIDVINQTVDAINIISKPQPSQNKDIFNDLFPIDDGEYEE